MEEAWVQEYLYSEYKSSPGMIRVAIKGATRSAIRRGSKNIDIEDLKEWRIPSMRAATDATTVLVKSPAAAVRKRRETVSAA
jgi:hypothetical protein